LAGKYALKPISRMPLEEVTARTGLERRRAEAACQREYGEAFFWDDPRPDVGGLTRDADALGLQWTKGGRCHHLLAGNDKGRAVRLLAGLHRSLVPDLVTAAVGDAANDEPMLAAVDHPYLVAQPHNGHADLAVPGLIRVPFPGPDGFRWSVDHWLETCR
jgi:predicted mannosyl-3-phosphoglycerate phosphatase (HAD superfamily)